MGMYNNIGLVCSEEDLQEFRTISLDSAFLAKFGHIPPACDLVKVSISSFRKCSEFIPTEESQLRSHFNTITLINRYKSQAILAVRSSQAHTITLI